MKEVWWDRYPDAFQAEKSALDDLKYAWKTNQEAWDSGRLVIEVELQHDGKPLRLIAEYPDSFPYFPPYVSLDRAVFDRHQHPTGKNLCLLAREGEDWQPGHDTLAKLLNEQFPKIQRINDNSASSDVIAAIEDHTAEPLSVSLPYPPDCAIIVPDEAPNEEQKCGRLLFNVRKPPTRRVPTFFVNGILREVLDIHGKSLFDFPIDIPVFSQQQKGFWIRLSDRPKIVEDKPLDHDLFSYACENLPALKKGFNSAKRGQILIVGFIYPDELSWRQTKEDWLFLSAQITIEAKGNRPAQAELRFIRTDWGGEQAWMTRAPSLAPIRARSALVVGLGSLGSPLTLHLARAGIGNLHLVDCDHLQIGNTVRWALGWQYAGFHKASALVAHIGAEYPYTKAHGYDLRIGASLHDYDWIRKLSEQVDIVIDSSANHRISYFLSDLTKELGKPYVWLTTTHGAAGGVVGRVVPSKTKGCWHCFQHGLFDKSIRLPANNGSAEVQPGGCSQPTFIGAGLDSDEIALLGARLAVATLSGSEPNGYPDFEWNVAVADMNKAGRSIAPDWTTYPLNVNAACLACNQL